MAKKVYTLPEYERIPGEVDNLIDLVHELKKAHEGGKKAEEELTEDTRYSVPSWLKPKTA